MGEYDVFHEPAMGSLIAIYFFLSGLGAGTFIVAALLRLFAGEGYEKIEKRAAIIAPICAMVGGLFLTADLGRPFRAFNMLLGFNPASTASWGLLVMSTFIGLAVIYAALLVLGRTSQAKTVGIVGLPFAAATGLYSGVLLYQMRGVELWHSPLIPVLFLVSALACGLALTIAVAGSGENGKLEKLGRYLAYVVAADLFLVLVELLSLAASGKTVAAGVLLSGWSGFFFVGVYVLLGLVVPLVVLFVRKFDRLTQIAAPALVLVGILAMRFVIVLGGGA
jgi:molybdopterin-containing oxidoreductase family membrane subunit